MSYNIQTYLARIAAMQEAAVSGSKAYPYFLKQTQDRLCWVNLYAGLTPQRMDSTQWQHTISIRMVLRRAHAGAGDATLEHEQAAQSDISNVVQYFVERPSLTLLPTDAPLQYMQPASAVILSEGIVVSEDGLNQWVGSAYLLTFQVLSSGG